MISLLFNFTAVFAMGSFLLADAFPTFALMGSITDAKAWYAVPLVIAVSLVYGATRHEHPKEIVSHAVRSALWVICFMSIILAIILAAGFWN